jgi:hypothetical protein
MRLKRALRRLHARQPWTPKPASDAHAAARVAPACAWPLGPSWGCGKRGRGAGRRGGFTDLGIAQRWARASTVARVRCVVRSWAPRRVAAPSYVASGPRATAGSSSSDRCERVRTRPIRKKRRKISHGTRIGSCFGIGASSVGSDVRVL